MYITYIWKGNINLTWGKNLTGEYTLDNLHDNYNTVKHQRYLQYVHSMASTLTLFYTYR